MITVNLLQNRGAGRKVTGGGAPDSTQLDFGTSADSGQGSAIPKKLVVNLIVILLGPFGLIYFEHYNMGLLKAKLRASQESLKTVQTDLTKKKTEIANAAPLKDKAKELSNKIAILTKLSKLRLREVKSLDYIQSSIPERVWLKDMSFRETKEAKDSNAAQGREDLVLKGIAMTDDDLTQFVKALENSAYFSGVLLQQAREEKSKEGSVKVFEISCKVETAD